MDTDKKWLAIYTKPRWEKKVYRLLSEKGIITYCPLNMVYKKWSDRIKKVEEPLFKSYLFVQVSPSEQSAVRMTDGVLNFVYWVGKPAVIRPEEIDAIRRFLNEYEEVEALPQPSLAPGSQVMVNAGIMMGATGIVEKMDNKWAEVRIDSIGYILRAKVPTSKLQLAKEGGTRRKA